MDNRTRLNSVTKADSKSSYREINPQKSYTNTTSPYPNNKIHSTSYTYLTLIPKTLFEEFYKQLSYFWFLLIIIFSFYLDLKEQSLKWYTLIVFILLLISPLIQNLRQAINRKKSDLKINQKKVSLWKPFEINAVLCQDLQVGDVILVNQNEIVPADILLLACKEGNIVQVVMSHSLGSDHVTEKKTLDNFKIGQRLDHNEIFLMLKKIESISTMAPNTAFDKFEAKVRYKGNPKTYCAGLNQFVIGGSKIIGNEWVLGLVVYTGMETKVWMNMKTVSGSKITKMITRLNFINIIHFFIILGFVFISISITYLNSNYFKEYSISETIMWNFIMYSNLISISLIMTIKSSKIISSMVIKYQTKDIDINYRVIQELGRVEYILADKNELVCGEKLRITTFSIGDQLFYKQIKSSIINTRHCQYEILKNNPFIEILPNCRTYDELIGDLDLGDLSENTLLFIFCAFFTSQRLSRFFKKVNKEDKKVKKMLEKFGVMLFKHHQSEISLKIKENIYKFTIIAELCEVNEYYSIVKSESGTYNIFRKQDFYTVKEALNFETSPSLMSFNSFLDIKPLTYAYKTIELNDEAGFEFDLNLAVQSIFNSEGKLKQVIEKYSKNMDFLGFLGFEYRNLQKVSKTLKKLKKVGIKTWMVSGDSLQNSMLACYSSGLFQKNANVKRLVDLNSVDSCYETLNSFLQEEVNVNNTIQENTEKFTANTVNVRKTRSQTRKITEKLNFVKEFTPNRAVSPLSFNQNFNLRRASRRKTFQSIRTPKIPVPDNVDLINYCLVIDSLTLRTILSNQETRKMLVVLLFLAESVCFCDLTPDQKCSVVHLLKKSFSFSPTVMALGALDANSIMLDEACVSVKITQSCRKTQNFDTSVVIPDFTKLVDIILVHGHYTYVRISKVFHYSVYRELMICTIMFLYQFQSGYSSALIMDGDLLVIFELFISLFPLLIIGVFEKDVNEKVAKRSSCVYSIGYFNYLTSNKRLAFYSFIGFFQGVINYIILFYGFGHIVNSKGFTEDSEVLGTLCFIVLSLSILQKVLITTNKFYYPTMMSPILTIGFIILCVVLTYYGKLTVYNNSQDILMQQSCFWVLVFTLPLFFTAGYFLFTTLYFKLTPVKYKNRLDMFKNSLGDVYKDSDIWKEDNMLHSLKINMKTLQFNSNMQEANYQNHLSSRYTYIIRLMTSLISIFMIVYLIFLYCGMVPALKYKEYAFFPAIFSLIFVILSFIKQVNHSKLVFSLLIYILIIFIASSILNDFYTIMRFPAMEVLFSICFNFYWKLTIVQMFLTFSTSVFIITYETIKIDPSSAVITSLYCVTLNLGITILCIAITYLIDYSQRKEYVFIQKVKKKFEKSNEILSFLLPEFVKKRVNDGVRYIAEEKGIVTIVFCDICEFDKIVEDYSPCDLIALLDDFFSRLDKVCENFGVSKIETVGKTFMACAGLKDFDMDLSSDMNEIPHSRRAIEMAFAVIQESKKTMLKNGNSMSVKIGIHSGPVVAGVVGFHKPQFSLVGDTVNTASRMASTLSFVNKIQISMETYHMLEDVSGLYFENNYPEVKGKGKMRTLLVEPARKSTENLLDNVKDSQDSTVFNSHLKTLNPENSNYTPKLLPENEDFYKGFQSSLTIRQKIIQILCVETQAEKEFQSIIYKNSFLIQYWGLIISASTNFILIIIAIVQVILEMKYSSRSRMIILVIEEFCSLAFLKYLRKAYKSRLFAYLLNTLYWTEMILFFSLQFEFNTNFSIEILFFYFRYLLLNFCTGLFFFRSTISNISLILVLLIKLIYFSDTIEDYIFSVFFVFCILSKTYSRESKLRKDYIIRHIYKEENEKTQQLLTQMLPLRVLRNLQEDVAVSDILNAATIMYADIVGFTQWSSTRSPNSVIGMLSELFTKFDKMCLEYEIYKVYTIGDCYVAMSYHEGISRNPANEAKKMVNFAFSLVNIIQEVNQSIGGGLNMRIGIHTGEAIGGINGTNIIRYDIYGKDVMIANKMESHGIPGKVAVSENTKEMLEASASNEFTFEYLKEVKAWDEVVKVYIIESQANRESKRIEEANL